MVPLLNAMPPEVLLAPTASEDPLLPPVHTEEPPTLEDIVIATDTFSDDDNSHSDTDTSSVTTTTQQTNLHSSLSLSNNDLVMEDVNTTLAHHSS